MKTRDTDKLNWDSYRLAVEMADRVSARRGTANAFFLTVESLFITTLFTVMSSRIVTNEFLIIGLALVGGLMSSTWYLQLRSYRDLNTAKFKVINALEESMGISVFNKEWEFLKQDEVKSWRGRYAELGVSERYMPMLFSILYLFVIVYEIVQLCI